MSVFLDIYQFLKSFKKTSTLYHFSLCLFQISLIFFPSLILITSLLLFALVLFLSAVASGGCLGYWFEDFFFQFFNISIKFYKFPSWYCCILLCSTYISFSSNYFFFSSVCVTHWLFRSMLLNFAVFAVFCALFLFLISFVLYLIWLFKFVVVCFMTQDIVYLECSVRLLEKNVYPTVIG